MKHQSELGDEPFALSLSKGWSDKAEASTSSARTEFVSSVAGGAQRHGQLI
ncbi:hypothetical protein [Pelomonas sp. KK5]|uniref:hypothetical protein n=1 Tax=Pelomonas sp. KK5 TaxID=1855730 RepID=UPI001301D0C6|nr:hypothetical protein [Pelomonas sp. KK5]